MLRIMIWAAIEAISTAAAVIVAGGGLIYAGKQLKQARLAREEQAQPYVVASPMPEESAGRNMYLLIRNYGPTAAHDLGVEFDSRISYVDLMDGSWPSATELQLSCTTLAPGQQLIHMVNVLKAGDPETGVREIGVTVRYTDWRGKKHCLSYRVSHGPMLPVRTRRPL